MKKTVSSEKTASVGHQNRVIDLGDPQSGGSELRKPNDLRSRADQLLGSRNTHQKQRDLLTKQLRAVEQKLRIARPVSEALQTLSDKLFEEVLGVLQEKLSIALQEVLEQPIKFVAQAEFKSGSAVVEFSIERDANAEDVRRGQGGSVHNILSVGLRMFALNTLDEGRHRRFLVLDEQDCWLRPELVPKLVSIVHQAARELDFQVLMISHHDVNLFQKYADKIYRMSPSPNGVKVELVSERTNFQTNNFDQ